MKTDEPVQSDHRYYNEPVAWRGWLLTLVLALILLALAFVFPQVFTGAPL